MSNVLLGQVPQLQVDADNALSSPVENTYSPVYADVSQPIKPMPVYASPIVRQTFAPTDSTTSKSIVSSDTPKTDKVVNVDIATQSGQDTAEKQSDTDLKEGFKISAPIIVLGAAAIYFFFFRKK